MVRFEQERCCICDVCRSLRLSAEDRWNHARELKTIYGLMTRVDKNSYGAVTAVMCTSRVESAVGEGVLRIWEKKY